MLKLGSLGLSFAYNMLTNYANDKEDDSNDSLVTNYNRLRLLRKTFEQHGGIFSKLSQILSYEDTHSSIFSNCTPYSSKETQIYLEEYINSSELSYNVDNDIYKSGSIGQVHIGYFNKNKRKIAIKIQYSGLYEKTEDDINALNLLSKFLYSFTDVTDAIKDIKKKIYEEFDFINEANNQEYLYKLWKDTNVYIPKVYKSLSTKKVLVTDFVEGVDLSQFIENSTQQERNKIANDLVYFMFNNIYNNNVFYSDCHYGNIIIQKTTDKQNKLSIIDFGCIHMIDKDMVDSLKKLHIHLKNEDKESVINTLKNLNILNDDVSKESIDYAYDYFRIQYRPFIVEEEFEFTDEWFKECDKKDTKLLSEWKLPRNMVYFNKIPSGFYKLLCALNAKGKFYTVLNDIFDI